jgi:hypothetical protein
MLEYECWIAKYKLVGDKLQCIGPTLGPGEQELILKFNNKLSFHAF